MGKKKERLKEKAPTDEQIMEQVDTYLDDDILRQQIKRYEDIKGMRNCTLCSHCHLINIFDYFVDGRFKCRATNSWRKITNSFEYNCKYFYLRSCLNCFYYNSRTEPCSVAKDRLEHGVDMRYSVCSHFRVNNSDYKLRNSLVLGRKYIPYEYRFDAYAMKQETLWIIDQVKRGNSKYLSARRYDKGIKDVMMQLYNRYELDFNEKAKSSEIKLEKLDKYLKDGYETSYAEEEE